MLWPKRWGDETGFKGVLTEKIEDITLSLISKREDVCNTGVTANFCSEQASEHSPHTPEVLKCPAGFP